MSHGVLRHVDWNVIPEMETRLEVVAGWKVLGDVEVVEGVGVDTYTGARLDMSVLQ